MRRSGLEKIEGGCGRRGARPTSSPYPQILWI